jgi:hypothetical protein
VRATPVLLALPLVGLFVVVQVALNTTLAEITTSYYPQNGLLVAQSADGDVPEQVRCRTLQDWLTQQGWPDYYRNAVLNGVQENYELQFGEPFCARLDTGSR